MADEMGAREVVTGALVVAADAVLVARGMPPIGGAAVPALQLFGAKASQAARERLEVFARALELAAGAPVDTVVERLAEQDDGPTLLYAALDALITGPGRDRAALLGAVLGRRVADEAADEQDALDLVLSVALGLEPAHLSVLAHLDDARGQTRVDPGDAWVAIGQLEQDLPGLRRVHRGALAALVANGTVAARDGRDGLSFGDSGVTNEWSVTELGATVVGFLKTHGRESSGADGDGL
ncbi:hypothetical protein [Cellulomonas wangsupingiae]|uniref:DUF222 domain-containing protein n=1 Tax=Cellulomonas wangsupingiae TaxID=2968085 RepID=A0ABY5K781_9CELL|nr:hypothetical protein [Cellulomonas wangsupingiae]MCC2334732.1 hypothetical protein [Cellulomonas wangsupingiae]UUI66312.1 hypothetical protein NP075_06240 [Cellulomonas wangsupingiae]